jgi:hypothetical protein
MNRVLHCGGSRRFARATANPRSSQQVIPIDSACQGRSLLSSPVSLFSLHPPDSCFFPPLAACLRPTRVMDTIARGTLAIVSPSAMIARGNPLFADPGGLRRPLTVGVAHKRLRSENAPVVRDEYSMSTRESVTKSSIHKDPTTIGK